LSERFSVAVTAGWRGHPTTQPAGRAGTLTTMVRRAATDASPRAFAIPGTGEWPHCRVSGPLYAHAAAEFARKLGSKKGQQSVRSLGRTTGVDGTVIARILRGEGWANGLQLFRICTQFEIELFSHAQLRSYRVAQLVEDFVSFVGRAELVTDPSDFVPRGPEAGKEPGFCPDIYVPESRLVIEVKAWPPTHAEAWRRLAEMAARNFQLLQESAGVDGLAFALLLADEPDQAQVDWLASHEILAIYPDNDGFSDSGGGWLVERIRNAGRASPQPK